MSPLTRFLISHGAGAFATGVHTVLLAWIAMQELSLSGTQWGVVQASALLPSLLLMLPAGAWADRFDAAKVLLGAHGLLTASYTYLFFLLVSGNLSFFTLLIYALLVGVGNAFVQPVREKLVIDIQSRSVQHRVSLLSITQFVMQSGGMALVALSHFVDIHKVVFVQALVSLIASLVMCRLFGLRREGYLEKAKAINDIYIAVKTIWRNTALKQLMALVAFNGYMHMGVFLVLIPIIATRVYQQNASEYTLLQIAFVAGMISAHALLLRKKTVEFPGQGALFSLLYTALIGFSLSKQPTPFGFYSLVFLWGLVAGNSAARCRLVLQSLASDTMKGRLMAVYQIMLFGTAPVGAIVTGLLVNVMSFEQLFLFMSGSSIALFILFLFTRTLWSIKQESSEKTLER